MRRGPASGSEDLVLIGGGHSHIAVLRRFGMDPLPGVRLTLICRELHTPYSGMLPGLIAGHYEFDEAHIDLAPLCGFAGARLIHAEAVGLDLAARRIRLRDRPDIAFDLLSINTGSTPAATLVHGAERSAIPVKPIGRFLERYRDLEARVLDAGRPLRIAVVGGGAGGVELALSIQHRLVALLASRPGGGSRRPRIEIFTEADGILPTHNPRTRGKFRRILAERGIEVHAARVVEVRPGSIVCESGVEHAVDAALWATQAGAPAWLGASGLAVDDRGFITVDSTLRSISHDFVFAAGDVAAMVGHDLEKAGVFAVRQGPVLTENLRRRIRGGRLRRYRPQREFLGIISTGDRYAVASRARWALEGRFVWRWKDWLDRSFIRRYSDLSSVRRRSSAMRGPKNGGAAEPGAEPRCAGCGAKVGASVLAGALRRLPPLERGDLRVGLSARDDAAVLEPPPGLLQIHSVDFFRALVDDPFLFGKIAATHALGDVYAMGGEPRSALAIATLPSGPDDELEELLAQMLLGVESVLSSAGAILAGGHTSESEELALGLAVQGTVAPPALWTKSGMRAGERLVLTKPLGTGVIFAAAMRLRAKGRWISGAVESMLLSGRAAADVLRAHGASACTDVTGFGLAGHLLEMAAASAVDVALQLDAVPALDGALELLRDGIESSLAPQNRRARDAIAGLEDVASGDPRPALIVDPQTCGALLASVPAARADECAAALRAAGYPAAALVGEVEARRGAESRIRATGIRSGR